MMKTYLCLGVLLVGSGCAYVPPTANIALMADVYHAVATGQAPGALAERISFCRGGGNVTLQRRWSEYYDDWISQMDDHATADNVDQVLRRDPSLHTEHIHSSVESGVATLVGQVSSDEVAMRAARDVVEIPGVVLVRVQLTSPQSPQLPPPYGALPCDTEWVGRNQTAIAGTEGRP